MKFFCMKLFNVNKNRILRTGIPILIVALLAFCIHYVFYSEDISKGLEENLIRLHVVANSNSDEDQALKIDVKNAIIEYMETKLKGSKDINESKRIINMNIDGIKKLVNEKIETYGKNYAVKIDIGEYPFPTKTYGDITLPAGNYQALKVLIGKGEGSNWWCVLFPPLCFVDVTHGTVPDSVKEELKNALTKEEYSIITAAESDKDIPVKIKFKILEFFQNSKMKFSGIISKIFNVSN
ncbi:MAG: stage II sporulation protein R [Firmicutes bacterium]|nr:stage II sporulation protein R [Bacillota bacterium]